MLTQYERNMKNRLYDQKPVKWDSVLLIYKNAKYLQANVFRMEVENLTSDYDKRQGYMLMDEIDRIYEYKLGEMKLKESVNKLHNLLGLLPDKYKLYYCFI